MIREIVFSHAYRLSANSDPHGNEVDPTNRLVWRHSPRRLEAEELRDAVLRASGQLDERKPIGSPAMKLRMVEMGDSGPVARSVYDDVDHCNYRSIYLPAVRGITPRSLAAFDPVSQSLVTGQRNVTTVATQALFLPNSNFVRKQAEAEAVVLVSASQDADERIGLAYVPTLNRDPDKSEVAQTRQFLDRFRGVWAKDQATGASQDPPAASAEGYLAPETNDGLSSKPPFEYGDMVEQNHLTFNDQAIHPASAEEAALASFVQALFVSTEFQYVR